PASGALLLFYHAERWIAHDFKRFYASIGMALSTDEGHHWTDLGEIVSPAAPFGASAYGCQMQGGSVVVRDGFFRVYFSDCNPDGSEIFLAAARAPVADVVDAATHRATAVRWSKFFGGTWTEPALGGRSTALEPGNPRMDASAVSFNAFAGRYVAIVVAPGSNGLDLFLMDSPDGLAWSQRQPVESEVGEAFYPAIVGQDDDPQTPGQRFWVYYTTSLLGGFDRWNDAVLARREIVLGVPAATPGAAGPERVFDAAAQFAGVQGQDQWRYQSRDASGYRDLSWDAAGQRWYGAGSFLWIERASGHPGLLGDAVRTWVAPTDGVVEIGGAFSKLDRGGGDGVRLTVLHGEEVVFHTFLGFNAAPARTLQLSRTVHAGDELHFVLGRGRNADHDATSWNPVIRFTPMAR
ncbi:MAG TPA: hypothetical protein VM369_10540, partial [Candidatus Binatia bacterium]|nr:hypothetical protein [Candidatus Binatia bacterium]